MISQILVTNLSTDSAMPLILMNPERSGFIVQSIDGLGPVNSTINMRENSIKDGSTFTSSRTPARNIVFTLSFIDVPSQGITIENVRHLSYEYFPLKARVRIDVLTDKSSKLILPEDPTVTYGAFSIEGYIESNTPSIFSQNEGCVISILCPDPHFKTDSSMVSGNIEQTAQLFSFPFSYEYENDNPELVNEFINNEASPRIWTAMGERFNQSILFPIHFDGSINVEPTFYLTADGGVVTNPRIFFFSETDLGVVQSLKFVFTTSLPALQDQDYLKIVCEKGNKSVQRFVAATGTFMNYIGAVTVDSTWPVLHPGDNLFSYEADSGGAYIRFSYEYTRKYVGV